MKKNIKQKTTALLCFFSLLMTIGLSGCGKAQNESSNKTSETASASESSETSDDKSKTSETSSKESSISKTSETSSKESNSDKTSVTSSEENSIDKTSVTSSEENSIDKTSVTSSEESSNDKISETSSQENGNVLSNDFTYSEDNNGNIILTAYSGKDASPEIPSKLDGKQVTAIGESCFAGNTAVKKIIIPENITEIGNYAFECCANLQEIIFPDSLKTIGEGTFSGCTELSAAPLTDNISVIKKGAFLFCISLENIEFPTALQELGNFAFSNCSHLKSVTFKGDKIKKLPDRLFYSCNKLTDINIQHTLESIGKRTFADCESLAEISLPGELQSIGDCAFEACSSLTDVSINAVSVSPTAYKACYKLPGDMIPEPQYESTDEEPQTYDSPDEMSKPDTLGSVADGGIFDEEKFSRYRIISNDEFTEWSRKYVDFCNENNIPIERNELFYTILYKGEVIPHYMGMTSAENHDPEMSKNAANMFGDDYEETYLMVNHGLYTELHRCRMCDDLVLYSGVYDSQIKAAAGTSEVPTLDQLSDSIGKTFTDPIMISTTTDIKVACNFSDTLFIIYASKESIDKLGAVSIDSIIKTNEKEILMSKNANYRVLDVGTMAVKTTDSRDNEIEIYRNYIKVELL